MDTFNHIKTLISIVLGLSITHLLRGAVRFIQHPDRDRPYWLHLLWAFYIFLLLIHFWWWEYRLAGIMYWQFTTYFFVIFYIIIFYVECALLFPEDLRDYDGYEAYFFSRKQWFFAVLALSFIVDIGDTLIKGKTYIDSLSIEYPIRNAVHFLVCLIAMRVNNRIFHGVVVSVFILYELSWILRIFDAFPDQSG